MKLFALREIGYVVAFVALLAVLYVGAYVAMVNRAPISAMIEPEELDPANGHPLYREDPQYRFGGEAGEWAGDWAERFFAPIHAIDRRLRPRFWRHSW